MITRYVTDEVIVNNSFFQLHEDTYVYGTMQRNYFASIVKAAKKMVKNRLILGTQICIIGARWRAGKSWNGDALGRMVDWWKAYMAYGVQLIKPDMTEEEFYSVLNWNGEDFLQFYYPELCEQYGISPRRIKKVMLFVKMERWNTYRNAEIATRTL